MTITSPLSARILKTNDWATYKHLRLEAVEKEPMAYWRTYAQEKALPRKEWAKRCSETANRHCAFGLFAGDELIGSVEIMRHEPEPKPGQAVLGQLYVREAYRGQENGSSLLLEVALRWTAEQSEWGVLLAASPNNIPGSQHALLRAGFKVAQKKPNRPFTETALWPATNTLVTQTWYGVDLETLRPQGRPGLPSSKAWKNAFPFL